MENCKKEDANEERFIWVIKDSNNYYCHKNSIGEKGNFTWQYISLKTFSQEARGYITEEQAKEAFVFLNKMNDIAKFNITFHLEYLNFEIIINQSKVFQGDNLVLHEKKLSLNPCKMTKIRTCQYSKTPIFTNVV